MLVKSILLFVAMVSPYMNGRIHSLRGTKVHPSAKLSSYVFIDQARPDLVTIEKNVEIGAFACLVTHDSSKTPTFHGKIIIEKGAYIGSHVTILPNIRIGRCATIGAGAVVTCDVPPMKTYIGVPARPKEYTKRVK